MITRIFKKSEKTTNKIRLPKEVVDKFGNEFYMEVYENYIKLIPVKESK